MWIQGNAPGRADLAGSLSDIYPIYLFEEHGLTVSAAINLTSSAYVKRRADPTINIWSKDYKIRQTYTNTGQMTYNGKLDAIKALIAKFRFKKGLDIVTQSDIPPNSGLGGSSSLLLALSAALNETVKGRLSLVDVIKISHFSEMQATKSISGTQDFYVSSYGGFNAIWFDWKGTRVEPLKVSNEFMENLATRLVLCCSRERRVSEEIDWRVVKKYIERKPKVVDSMRNIIEIAHDMRDAVLNEDLEAVGILFAKDWEKRKRLDRGISAPRTGFLMSKALESLSSAVKVCGSGGGGSFLAYCEPKNKQKVAQVLSQNGGIVIDFAFTNQGLIVSKFKDHL